MRERLFGFIKKFALQVDYNNEVATFIKSKMSDNGISNRDMARNTGISDSTIGRYMNLKNEMPFDAMVKCLDALGYGFEIVKR